MIDNGYNCLCKMRNANENDRLDDDEEKEIWTSGVHNINQLQR